MPQPIVMPRIGQSVESCIITQWHKNIGDPVKMGDILFSYETDKAAFEFASPCDGTLLELFFAEGDDVPCLCNVGVIGNEGEAYDALKPDNIRSEAPPAPADEPAKTTEAEAPPSSNRSVEADQQMFLSPRARKLAAELRVDYRLAKPSGAENRIIERDIRDIANRATMTPSAFECAPAFPPVARGSGIGGMVTTDDQTDLNSKTTIDTGEEYQEIPLSKIRQLIARSMHASLSEMAQLSYHAACKANQLLALRKELKHSPESLALSGVSINDILLFAVSRILPEFPLINAHFTGDTIKSFREVHLGVAVNTERGLMVPTVFHANRKSLREISGESKQLAAACQAGTINPDLLRGATFTVSNLGAFGVSHFTPIVNPPQTAILGVGGITGQYDLESGDHYPALGLSLTADHRVVDGVPAAQFLKELCRSLEHINILLAV